MNGTFTCTFCGAKVTHPARDAKLHERNGWRCGFCVRILSEKRYPVDTGGITVFAAHGKAVGDVTVMEVVGRVYQQDNPSETVIFLNHGDDHDEAVRSLKPKKFFMSEFCRDTMRHAEPIRFNAMNDICAWAKQGIYPELQYEPAKPNISLFDRYVCVHLRNIEKDPRRPQPERNVSPELAGKVLELLTRDRNVVLVGNDDPLPLDGYQINHANLLDLRHKLTLPEVAWVIREADFFAGRDSGIVHVAAATGQRIMAWDFANEKWFPKTATPYVAMMRDETTHERILEILKGM